MKSNSKDGVINFYCCCIFFGSYSTMLKALGVRSLNYYALFCNMFIFFLYFRSIWMNLHVVSWVYCIVYNTLGCMYNIKWQRKISRKNYGFLVNQEKWLKIWWKYVTCFSYGDKVQMYAISCYEFFLSSIFLLCYWICFDCSHVRQRHSDQM